MMNSHPLENTNYEVFNIINMEVTDMKSYVERWAVCIYILFFTVLTMPPATELASSC